MKKEGVKRPRYQKPKGYLEIVKDAIKRGQIPQEDFKEIKRDFNTRGNSSDFSRKVHRRYK